MAAEQAAIVSNVGVTLMRKLVQPALLRKMNNIMRERAALVMAALGDKPIGIGSREGYDEIVQRSPGRFDIPLDEAVLTPVWGEEGSLAAGVPWLGVVKAILGPSAQPSFCGVVFSKPGSPAQQWHIDSPHESAETRPAHAVNVLLALADVPLEAGPTEVARGTHLLTNHLKSPWLSREDLLYQTESEIIPSALIPGYQAYDELGLPTGRVGFEEALQAGDCLIFDDRALHRGRANRSRSHRWVAYFSYSRSRLDCVTDTHFEATRRLF